MSRVRKRDSDGRGLEARNTQTHLRDASPIKTMRLANATLIGVVPGALEPGSRRVNEPHKPPPSRRQISGLDHFSTDTRGITFKAYYEPSLEIVAVVPSNFARLTMKGSL